eukprot:s1657_g11.t1
MAKPLFGAGLGPEKKSRDDLREKRGEELRRVELRRAELRRAAFAVGVVKAVDEWKEGAVEAVQEAAEAVGNFITNSFKAGKEWFLEFVQNILKDLVDQGKGLLGKGWQRQSSRNVSMAKCTHDFMTCRFVDQVSDLGAYPSGVTTGPGEPHVSIVAAWGILGQAREF